MLKLPQNYQLITTEDGSETVFSEIFQENCHSTSGAVAETQEHYIRGCKLDEIILNQNFIHILEVGFGTGIGWQETLKFMSKHPQVALKFVSLELDEELVKWSAPNAIRKSCDNRVWYEEHIGNAQLMILIGDARMELPKWKEFSKFHAIYQDAFSPKKNPTLWTHEWFSLLGSLSEDGCYLSTYSSSISIRKALIKAGWGVYEGKPFAKKKSSTRATWGALSEQSFIDKLNLHSTPPLSDQDLL